jgi:hypothetical protein
MLDHLRRHVVDLLAPVHVATLSTCGPAGIQAQVLPCEADDVTLYLMVPITSEHLYNLERDATAVVTTAGWQLRGAAQVMNPADAPARLRLVHGPRAVGCLLVRIFPRTLHIGQANGWGFSETIDISDEPDALPAV